VNVLIFALTFIIEIISIFWGDTLQLAQDMHNWDHFSQWFTDVDGKSCSRPCLFGTVPNVTTFDEGIKILTTHPALTNIGLDADRLYHNSFRVSNSSFYILMFYPDGNDKRISGIEVFYGWSRNSPTLQHIIEAIGAPSHASLDSHGVSPDYYFFFDGKMAFETWNTDNLCQISPTLRLEKLTLYNYDSRGSGVVRWKGFINRAEYGIAPTDTKFLKQCKNK
jgi:hypothetical protein